jgi:hypothetical protein
MSAFSYHLFEWYDATPMTYLFKGLPKGYLGRHLRMYLGYGILEG